MEAKAPEAVEPAAVVVPVVTYWTITPAFGLPAGAGEALGMIMDFMTVELEATEQLQQGGQVVLLTP